MATPIKKFRNGMDSFIKTLKSWANKDQLKELEKFKIKYDAGMGANPYDTTSFFVDALSPFADKIMQSDEEFFLKKELDQEDEQLGGQLRKWWPELTTQQRETIKTQFKLCFMLGVIATKNEEMRKIINNYRDEDNPLEF